MSAASEGTDPFGLFETLPNAVLVVEADGTLRSSNRLADELVGISPRDHGEKAATVVPLITSRGDDVWACARTWSALPRVTRTPERLFALGPDPSRGRPTEISLGVALAFVRSGTGEVLRTVAVLNDTRAADRVGRSNADLVSTVAHELRSPLTSVKGFTATLLAKWDRFPDEQKRLMLQTVNADADRVTRLLTELLDVSRIDAGRLEMRRQVVDLPALARRTFAGRVASGEPADRFILRVGEPPPELWLDPDKIEQLVGNLVENAVRHGGGQITVEVRGSQAPSGATLVVSDQGDGIPDAALGRIFTKFWRGGVRPGGTGLGLYIVKGLVEAHGGTVEAGRSQATGGAEFRIFLPAGHPPWEDG